MFRTVSSIGSHTAREPYVVQACVRQMTRIDEKKSIKNFCERFSLKMSI
jgi:hypothetical protein